MITTGNTIVLRDFAGTTCTSVSDGLPDKLRFEVDGPTSQTQDWAAVAMLFPAMYVGRDLHVDGAVCETLLFYLNHDIQGILKRINPRLTKVAVTARQTHRNNEDTGRVGMGFSAGVDSFTSLKLHPEVTHLTIFNVGSMGAEPGGLFDQYIARTKAFAEQIGASAVSLDSNLDQFFAATGGVSAKFIKTHTMRNAAAALALDMSDYYYSSAVDYSAVGIQEYALGYMDPVLLPLLSTRSSRLHSSGTDLTRVQKTQLIATIPEAQSMLDVCVGNPAVRARGETELLQMLEVLADDRHS